MMNFYDTRHPALVQRASKPGSHFSPLALLMAVALLLAMTPRTGHAIAYSPPSIWAKIYGDAQDEEAFAAKRTPDGGFIVGGTTASFGAGRQDFWILKTNANGAVQWQRAYGGEESEFLMAMEQTSDGGYIAVGSTHSFGEGRRNLWVLKIDADGELEWQNAYGGSNVDGPAAAVQQTTDGGYITGGFTYSFGTGGDLLVLKLDPLGNIEWQRNYGGTGAERRLENVRQTGDGGYILLSTSTSFTADGSALWVLKIDPLGAIQWQRVYPGDHADAEDIQLTDDGGYIVVAESSARPADPDYWVLKLEEDGDIEWQKAYGGTGDEDVQPIRQTSDGGYVVGGSTNSFGAGDSDVWLIKLDAAGNVEWQKTHGGSRDEDLISLEQVSEGYIAAGWTQSFGADDKDLLLLRLNRGGGLSCCEPTFRSGADAPIVTDTDTTPVDTSVVAAESEAVRTPTDAIVTDTSAGSRRLCYFRILLPEAVAMCHTATWWRLAVLNPWLTGLWLIGAIGLLFLGVMLINRWRRKN